MITKEGYLNSKPDSAFYFAQVLYDFAEKRGLKKEMAWALRNQGVSFYLRSDFVKALDFYERSLNLYDEIADKIGIASALNNIGNIYMIKSDFPKDLDFYRRSLQIKEEFSDKRGMANPLHNIGSAYFYMGDYPKALDYYRRSLKIKEELSDTRGMAQSLNNIGGIYAYQEEYARAMEYYQRCLDINEKLSDKKGMASALNNIGFIHNKQEDYEKAMEFYQRSLEIANEISDERGMASTLNHVGGIYTRRGNYKKAMDCYQRSLNINEEISDERGMVYTLNNIGRNYIEQGEYVLAVNQCKKALYISQDINILKGQKNACQCLYDAYKAMGDVTSALKYHERIIILDDSLRAEETSEKLQQMEFARQMLADSLLREKEKLRIQLAHDEEVRRKTRQRNIYFFSVLAIISLSIFIVLYLRLKARNKRIITEQRFHQLEEEKKLLSARGLVEGQEEERKRIAKELHDGLGVLLSVSKMQFSAVKNANPDNLLLISKAIQSLEQANSDVRKISRNLMPGIISKLGLYEALEELFDYLSQQTGIDVVCNINIPEDRIPEHKEIMIYRIVQEMVNNTIKHAEAGKIEFQLDVSDHLNISYTDNGKGFDVENSMKQKSLGLQNIWSRIRFLDGTISIKSEAGKGTAYKMQIPYL